MIVRQGNNEGMPISLTRKDLAKKYTFNAISTASEGAKTKQLAEDTNFLGAMTQANQAGVFAPMQYNLPKHITEITLPLMGQKNSKDMFIQAPPMPMMPAVTPEAAAPMPEEANAGI